MICRHCRRLLSPHLDNALAAGERNEVVAHLAQCSACAAVLNQLERNRHLVRGLPPAEVTKGMSLLLQSRLQQLEAKSKNQQETENWRRVVSSFFSWIQSPKPQSWWRGWGMISVGTLATGVASVFLFFSNAPTAPRVPAEEVVGSMEELIAALDSDEAFRAMYQETEEEAMPDWREDLNRWPAGRWRDFQRRQ